jgi:hypothetical protein
MGTMQSEQARQRKRERKRLEREKKRQRSQAGLPDEIDLVFAWRPMTATDDEAQMCARAEVDIVLPRGSAPFAHEAARYFGRAPRKRPTRPGASS